MDELRRLWGQNVAKRRRAMGMTQEQLAAVLGVRQATVSKWESGAAAPRDGLKIAVATALQLDVSMLFPLVRVSA